MSEQTVRGRGKEKRGDGEGGREGGEGEEKGKTGGKEGSDCHKSMLLRALYLTSRSLPRLLFNPENSWGAGGAGGGRTTT